MKSVLIAFFAVLASSFRTSASQRAEILALRHQLAVLQANAPRCLRLKRSDRVLWVLLSRWFPAWRQCLRIVQPATVIAWHRRAFALYWTRKSRRRPGRPQVTAEIRALIQHMSQTNPLWGAPRIHGELLKLGIEVAESTVAKYTGRRRKPPSQTWQTFLSNHLAQMASMDFFTVPTATFRVLFVLVILSHARRRIAHFAVTEHPTQEWTVQQLREAFPWNQSPQYLLRDRDAIYGEHLVAVIQGMGNRPACKRNPIEHRLFSEISRNWAGEPLDSYQKILNYARTTQTQTVLRVTAYLDRRHYPRGLKPRPDQIASLRLQRHQTLPGWNYTIKPQL